MSLTRLVFHTLCLGPHNQFHGSGRSTAGSLELLAYGRPTGWLAEGRKRKWTGETDTQRVRVLKLDGHIFHLLQLSSLSYVQAAGAKVSPPTRCNRSSWCDVTILSCARASLDTAVWNGANLGFTPSWIVCLAFARLAS